MRSSSKRSGRSHLFSVVVTYCPKTRGPYKYAVEVPALPGCFSDGRSREEALENVKEAIALYIQARKDLQRKGSEVVEVVI